MPIQSTKRRAKALDPFRVSVGKRFYAPIRTGPRRESRWPGESQFPDPPADWKGTLPEWAIYWAHTQLGLKPGVDFLYLLDSPLTGDIQVDFYEVASNTGIQVQGEFWHYEFARRAKPRDLAQRSELTSVGLTVIWIDEDDAIRSPLYYLREALAGRDHSAGGQFGL